MNLSEAMKPMVKRFENAEQNFIDNVKDQFGFTAEEAEKILKLFKVAKAIKLNIAMGRYDLTHGAFWDREVMTRALKVTK